jgi:predicted AAA+ superfamily ATPase
MRACLNRYFSVILHLYVTNSVILPPMFTRLLKTPRNSYFLLGPRGTGKSTWVREHYPDAPLYDLLDTGESLRLSREPAMLYRELQILPPGAWVVIDEIQKVPARMALR